MRMPVAIALMAVCLVAGFGVGAKFVQFQHPHEDDQTVMNAIMASENKIVGTLENNDIDAFAKMLPDDLIDIEGDGIHQKSEWLKTFQEQKDGGHSFAQFRFEDPHLLRLGPDAAIMYSSERWHAVDKGKPSDAHVYTHALYVRRSGRWVPIFYQDSDAQK